MTLLNRAPQAEEVRRNFEFVAVSSLNPESLKQINALVESLGAKVTGVPILIIRDRLGKFSFQDTDELEAEVDDYLQSPEKVADALMKKLN